MTPVNTFFFKFDDTKMMNHIPQKSFLTTISKKSGHLFLSSNLVLSKDVDVTAIGAPEFCAFCPICTLSKCFIDSLKKFCMAVKAATIAGEPKP